MADSEGVADGDILIALLGLTGAGKTTFVKIASGDQSLVVGHSIYPCTQEPKAVPFRMPDGRKIILIDTPGFDDDNRSDVEILEGIAKWMSQRGYLKRHRLDGLILLHPITVHRVGGTERRRTKLLQTILGEKAYNRIIIATTMWEQLNPSGDIMERQEERRRDLWSDLVNQGAQIREHYNNRDSAHRIIQEIVHISQRCGKLEPLLQTELTGNPNVIETTAGRTVKQQLLKDIKLSKSLLKEHELNRPERLSKRERKERKEEWEAWSEWRDKKAMLEERLDIHQVRLKRLNSLSFRLKNFFTGLFGG
ncbi:P-loop containing nucleoside triphosphate hydrolase protein [Immersiella caudata]|uniref:P-loop containing nucleoside triphosphate hydrolase protein n=1 Tax=Immersiella caudata TaxID=314043 RepID=A0AA39WY99_9PEZI|nr:P-loop containing nucleoside triphosphate hydrolase protein [Immersiella caudata]